MKWIQTPQKVLREYVMISDVTNNLVDDDFHNAMVALLVVTLEDILIQGDAEFWSKSHHKTTIDKMELATTWKIILYTNKHNLKTTRQN